MDDLEKINGLPESETSQRLMGLDGCCVMGPSSFGGEMDDNNGGGNGFMNNGLHDDGGLSHDVMGVDNGGHPMKV